MTNIQRKSTHGGRRPGAGRKKGQVNKITADIREAAQTFTNDALNVLAQIMREGESEAARVAAANSILDRGYGKPRQAVDVDANVAAQVSTIVRRIVDPANPNG